MTKESFKPDACKAGYVEQVQQRWRGGIQGPQHQHESGGYTGDGDTGVDLADLQRTKEWAQKQDWTVPKPYDGD